MTNKPEQSPMEIFVWPDRDDFQHGNGHWSSRDAVFGQGGVKYTRSDALEAHEWQDISSAPKDGTVILVPGRSGWPVPIAWIGHSEDYDLPRSRLDKLLGRYPREKRQCPKSWVAVSGDNGIWYGQWNLSPTHWQPLPQPPEDRDD